jgi:hypothetical protein
MTDDPTPPPSSTPPSLPPAATADASIETFRHPLVSVFQSAIDHLATRRAELSTALQRGPAPRQGKEHPFVLAATLIAGYYDRGEAIPLVPPDQMKVRLGTSGTAVWTCARLAFELFEARATGNEAKATKVENELKFSTCDPGWIASITDYLGYFGLDGKKRTIPYVDYTSLDDFVLETVEPTATVAILGDWGTGDATALAVLQDLARQQPDVLIHLGDIYYSGTRHEVTNYFVSLIDRVFDRSRGKLPVYTLTGNHDMYSGGGGYYGLLGQLNPAPPFSAAQRQAASYFCLRTTDGSWQFLGMDTGLHDHDPFSVQTDVTYLEPKEEAWHVDKIRRFSATGGRTILLSHHQLFSAFSGIGTMASKAIGEEASNPKLLESYRAFAAAGAAAGHPPPGAPDPIAAWFWGHEHNLCVYQPYLGLAKGRCVGHGAIPVLAAQQPYKVVAGLSDPPQLVASPRQPDKPLQLPLVGAEYPHGYVLLRLAGKKCRAQYFTVGGATPLYEEDL